MKKITSVLLIVLLLAGMFVMPNTVSALPFDGPDYWETFEDAAVYSGENIADVGQACVGNMIFGTSQSTLSLKTAEELGFVGASGNVLQVSPTNQYGDVRFKMAALTAGTTYTIAFNLMNVSSVSNSEPASFFCNLNSGSIGGNTWASLKPGESLYRELTFVPATGDIIGSQGEERNLILFNLDSSANNKFAIDNFVICEGTRTAAITGNTTVAAGGTLQLGLGGSGAFCNTVWTSGNTGVATVDQNGLVTGLSAGSALITLNRDGKIATETITVTSNLSIVNRPAGNALTYGAKITLGVQAGVGISDNVTWSSDNAGIAAIDQSGHVTALTVGTTVITADNGNESDSFVLRVKGYFDESFDSALISGGSSIGAETIYTKDTVFTLTNNANEVPAAGSGYALKVAASGGKYYPGVTFPINTLITGHTYTLSCSVRYLYGAKTVAFKYNGDIGSLGFTTINESKTFSVPITAAAGKTNFEIFLISEGRDGAFVIDDIKVEPTPSLKITNKPANNYISMSDGSNVDLDVQKTGYFGAASETWSSSNTDVATINSSTGVITPAGGGQTTITVTCNNVSDSFVLTVYDDAEVVINDKPYHNKLRYGETAEVSAEVIGAQSQGNIWSTSNSAVATISQSGEITALKMGTTTITVTNGSYTDFFVLKVIGHFDEDFENAAKSGANVVGEITVMPKESTLDITTNPAEVPFQGGKALKINAASNGWAGINFNVPGLVTGEEYELSFDFHSLTDEITVYTEYGTQATTGDDRAIGSPIQIKTEDTKALHVNKSFSAKEGIVDLHIFEHASGTGNPGKDFVIDNLKIEPVKRVRIKNKPAGGKIFEGENTTLQAFSIGNLVGGFTWQSDNTSVAVVNQNGEIEAISKGSATITLIKEGISDSFDLFVIPKQEVNCENFDDAIVNQDGKSTRGNVDVTAEGGANITLSLTDDINELPVNGSGKALVYEGTGVSWGGVSFKNLELIPGARYTVSFDIRLLSGTANLNVNYNAGQKEDDLGTIRHSDGETQHISRSFTAKDVDQYIKIFILGEVINGSFVIDNFMVVQEAISFVGLTVKNGNTIVGIEAGTTEEMLNIIERADITDVVFTGLASNGAIKTGTVVQAYVDQALVAEYTLIVKGDINGDGLVDNDDVSLIRNVLLGKTVLIGNSLLAADIYDEGSVTLNSLKGVREIIG